MRRLRRRTLVLVLWAVCFSDSALAEQVPRTGRDATGMPGLDRVGIPVASPDPWAIAGSAGYGFTESITMGDQSHGRFIGRLGLAFSPLPWLNLGMRLDGRIDTHEETSGSSDSGMVGDPWFVTRVGRQLSQSLIVGGELGIWFPGQEAPSIDFGATTAEAKLIAASVPRSSPWILAAIAGFRLDRSARSAPDADSLELGDRIALGVSDFNAALLGAGAGYRLGETLLMVEASADLLLGIKELGQSPVRVSAGARHFLSDALEIELLLVSSLSSRPDVGPGSELIPIEPRVSATLGLRYAFGADEQDLSQRKPPPKAQRPKPPPPPEEPKATSAPIVGLATDEAGTPLAQVEITLTTEQGETSTEKTDNDGRYQFDAVPFGKVTLRAQTVDYDPAQLTTSVAGSGDLVEVPTLKLRLATLKAQVQGLVRSFEGLPLRAVIQVSPPGEEHRAGPDGRFAIDVEPGTYKVTISADGYRSQTRTVSVPEKGVIVFNADLRKR